LSRKRPLYRPELSTNGLGRRPYADTPLVRFGVDEIPQVIQPFLVVSRDPHDVAVVHSNHGRVLVDKRLPHGGGVFLIHAVHDGLGNPVAAIEQELGFLL
jgi:hypothetical protein